MKRAAIIFVILLLSALSCQALSKATGGQGGVDQQPAEADLSGYFLPNPAVGIDTLKSFTQKVSISFKGNQNGEPVEFTDSYYRELNRETNTQFTYMDITGLDGTLSATVSGNVGEAYYAKSEDGECRVSWGQRAEGVELFLPERLLPPIQAATENGSEVINDVQTRRYVIDASSQGGPSNSKVDGQVWLAMEGSYVVKYSLHILGDDAIFGEGVDGEQFIEYELGQVNTPNDLQLPEGCLPVLADFPIMPEATEVQRLPNVLAYTSSSSVSQVSGFYEEQLQGLGWTLAGSHPYPQDGKTLVFRHEGDKKKALITLQAPGGGTWVTIKIEPIAESVPAMAP